MVVDIKIALESMAVKVDVIIKRLRRKFHVETRFNLCEKLLLAVMRE